MSAELRTSLIVTLSTADCCCVLRGLRFQPDDVSTGFISPAETCVERGLGPTFSHSRGASPNTLLLPPAPRSCSCRFFSPGVSPDKTPCDSRLCTRGHWKKKKKRKEKAGSKVMCAFHCTDYSLFLDKLYMCVYISFFLKKKTKQMTMCMWPSHVKFLTVNIVNNYLMKEPTFPQRNKWGENIATLWPLIFFVHFCLSFCSEWTFYFAFNEITSIGTL